MGSSNSSDDGQTSQTTLKKLNRHNWLSWKTQFKNIVTAKGYEDIMNNNWIKANKKTPEYQKISAWCMNKLFSAVKEELHPVLVENNGNTAKKTVSTACS